jgi:hypothetical protein
MAAQFYLIEARQQRRWAVERRLLQPRDQVKEFEMWSAVASEARHRFGFNAPSRIGKSAVAALSACVLNLPSLFSRPFLWL